MWNGIATELLAGFSRLGDAAFSARSGFECGHCSEFLGFLRGQPSAGFLWAGHARFFQRGPEFTLRTAGPRSMKKLPSFFLFLAIVSVVAACAAGVGVAIYAKWRPPVLTTAHDWGHSDLGITAEQEKELVPIEQRYHARRNQLEHRMQEANAKLAEAILADGCDSERVHRAIEQIHKDMGDIQKVTIGHVFEMQAVLSPEQYERLLKLTADALRNIDAASEHGGHH